VGLLAAVVVYASLRAGQLVLAREPHPLEVVLSERSGFVWRVVAACFAGGLAAIAAHPIAVAAPEAVARFLERAIPIAAVLALAQAVLAP